MCAIGPYTGKDDHTAQRMGSGLPSALAVSWVLKCMVTIVIRILSHRINLRTNLRKHVKDLAQGLDHVTCFKMLLACLPSQCDKC